MAIWSAFLARPAKPIPRARPSLTLFFLLSGAFLLTLVPHAIQFPFWVSLSILTAMAVRSFLEVYRLPLPSTTFSGAIAIIFLVLILLQFGTLRGREAGTAFTAGLIAIKFYELRRPRDMALIIFSCFFVVMSALLFSQVLELFLYCLIMMWVLVALLLRVQMGDTPQDRLLSLLRVSGVIFLQAAPLTLLLFFFFPRYHGPIGLPLDDTPLGFTDRVAPGSIAKLAQNDAKVMYVEFLKGNPPLPESMYWRGLVLWDYRNGTWVQGDNGYLHRREPSATESNPLDTVQQRVTILAHNQPWLFALDVPVAVPVNAAEPLNWASFRPGNVLQLSAGKLDHIARYDVLSSLKSAPEVMHDGTRKEATALPSIDSSVQNLADQLHEGLGEGQEREYVYAVIHYLRHNGFVYTIEPGDTHPGPGWLADFLFVNKKGFCEHYASAFAVLMRAEGIPARVVVGYLGGDFNPYDGTYLVTQDMAHAWDEIWIPEGAASSGGKKLGHWARFDPTSLISTADSMPLARNNSQSTPGNEIKVVPREPGFFERHLPQPIKDAMKQFKLRRDQVETHWDNVVLSYNGETQIRFAQALGMGKTAWVGLSVVCVMAIGVCLFVFRKWVLHKPPVPPVEKLYAAFCRTMARRGMPRALWEGPLAYTERVAEVFPETRREIQHVGIIVSRARYGPVPADDAAIEKLNAALMVLSASQATPSARELSETSLPK